MRITIQVTCDDAEDAQRVMRKLAALDNTWVEQIDKTKGAAVDMIKGGVNEARLDKIMGSAGGEVRHGNNGGAEEPRPSPAANANVSPGEPSITKIGGNTKAEILNWLATGVPIPRKYDEHMKLLWKRGEIKFDGEEFYL